MNTELMLFWLAVLGDLVLFYYVTKMVLRTIGSFARSEKTAGLWRLSAACVLSGLAVLPLASLTAWRAPAGFALWVCLAAPTWSLWAPAKKLIAWVPKSTAGIVLLGAAVPCAINRDWTLFPLACLAVAGVWAHVVAKAIPAKRPNWWLGERKLRAKSTIKSTVPNGPSDSGYSYDYGYEYTRDA